ncbi:hypothetical protein [Jutongia sp.]|uniref:hypothetical protein n=1 Tax=Jutongia sp. TaxID=2944204 RepID=UPI00307AD6D5
MEEAEAPEGVEATASNNQMTFTKACSRNRRSEQLQLLADHGQTGTFYMPVCFCTQIFYAILTQRRRM